MKRKKLNRYITEKRLGRVPPQNVSCGECGSPMVLRPSKYGLFYGCTQYPMCKGTHGAHPDGMPMGKPADKGTRELRQKVHMLAENIWPWRSSKAKKQMYTWMRENAPKEHIGEMDKEELMITTALLKNLIRRKNEETKITKVSKD